MKHANTMFLPMCLSPHLLKVRTLDLDASVHTNSLELQVRYNLRDDCKYMSERPSDAYEKDCEEICGVNQAHLFMVSVSCGIWPSASLRLL